ncbi:MAG TPA: hypothetical protein VLW55_01475 [Burkholderiaceae bacterium]|nr:hypothetical protein [Burkholderiaceae bacterium]
MLATLAALASHPERLVAHLQQYGELAAADAAQATEELLRRVTYLIVAVELLACGIILAGVALLLMATTPAAEHQWAWALWVVPAVPLIGAALAWLKVRKATPQMPFATLRTQIAADAKRLESQGHNEGSPPSNVAAGVEALGATLAPVAEKHPFGVLAAGAAAGSIACLALPRLASRLIVPVLWSEGRLLVQEMVHGRLKAAGRERYAGRPS